MQLSVYLFDVRVTSLDGVRKRAEEDSKYEVISVSEEISDVVALTKTFYHNVPEWVRWVSPWISVPEDRAKSTSLALIIFLLVDGRVFAVPFGFGHTAIDKKLLERDFGFQAALRFLDPTELSLIDLRNVGKRTRQKRSSLALRGTIQEFDVAIDNELAFKIAGNSEDESLGKRIVGGTSFVFDCKNSIDTLKDTCSKLLSSLNEPPKKDFEQINPYIAEKDESVLQELDGWLLDSIRKKSLDNLSVALPELEITLAANYKLYCRRNAKIPIPDLMIEHIADALAEVWQDGIDVNDFRIKAYDADDKVIPKQSYLLRDCLVAEKQTDDACVTYILSLGKWYRVKKDFIDDTNREVLRIPVISDDDYLPVYNHSSEGDCNQAVASGNPTHFVCLDSQSKHFREGLGISSVEVCDLYTEDKHLICVKRYHASQSMNYLFSQGIVSAKFLKQHNEYREFLLRMVGTVGQFQTDSFREEDFTFVYAVVLDSKKSLPRDLPFFSKVRLIEDARNIKGMGFGLKLYHIPIGPAVTADDLLDPGSETTVNTD